MAEYILDGTVVAGATALSTSTVKLTIAFSGQVEGSTVLYDQTVHDLSGALTGGTTLSTPSVRLLRSLFGSIVGSTILAESYPVPVHGRTTLSQALLTVDKVAPAIHACTCDPGKVFHWLHEFSRNDLTLFLTDPARNARISPFEVTFTLFRIVNGFPIQAGPANRRPVMQDVGEYYATGKAGEFGQPGDWQIRWTIRRSFNDTTVNETQSFRVVDVISDPIPGDPTCRQTKYGWS